MKNSILVLPKKKNNTFIVSLGGSLIAPPKGINYSFLKKFRQLILEQTKKGNKFFIITGGGNIAREYQKAAKRIVAISSDNLDWIGISATRINAHLIKSIFRNTASQKVIEDPTVRIKTKRKIVLAGGWKPGWSTDFVSIMIAQEYKAKTVINLSNIDYVYDRDPKKFKNAEKIKEINWKDFYKIVGNKWSPGLNAPFDPIASRKADQLGLKVVIANGEKIANLKNLLDGKKYNGTTIQN